jgi:hypothetical protein
MTLPTKPFAWTRSSSCSGGNCVEVASAAGQILVRNSKDPAAGMLSFSAEEWDAFIHAVKRDEFRFV